MIDWVKRAKTSRQVAGDEYSATTLEQARERGRRACLDGELIYPNPFNGSTLRGKAWTEGYRAAYRAKTEKP